MAHDLHSAGRWTNIGVISLEKFCSGLAWRFSVNEAFGLHLPLAEKFLHTAVIVDGLLHQDRLRRREHSMDEFSALHVAPLVIRSMARADILSATATGFAAHLRAFQ